MPAYEFIEDFSRAEGTLLARNNVSSLSAVVVGAGALGNEVVRLLGLAGVGEVVIVDPDVVEPSNLSRSVLFRLEPCVGRNKAETLADAGRRLFPSTRFRACPGEIADIGLGEICRSSLIFSCVDSDMARVEIAWIGCKLEIPVADAGLGGGDASSGRVTWFPGRRAACYCCLLRPARRRELLVLQDSVRQPCWADFEPGAPVPGTPTLSAIVAAMQVEVGFRQFFEGRPSAHTVTFRLSPDASIERIRHHQSPACPFHRDDRSRNVSLAAGDTLVKLFGSPADRVELDWPICLQARCETCGGVFEPRVRVGVLRRRGACPKCAGHRLTILDVVREITSTSPFSACFPMQLGLPENHVYTVMTADA